LEDKIKETIDYLKKKKVDYADIRHQKISIEDIKVKNGNVEALSRNDNQGFGIRVIADGSWGFAASSICTQTEMKRVANQALKIAKASTLTKKENVKLTETDVHKDKYRSQYSVDPFEVPIGKKIGLLLDACAVILKNQKIKVAEGSMEFFKTDKVFASTEGAFIEQSILESGAGITATAVDG
jgi:TldD protein